MVDFLAKCPPEQVESMRFVCEPPEYFACRVLRARKFVVEDSLKLVAETTAWRKEMKIAELCKKDPLEILGGVTEDELQVRKAGAGRRARRGSAPHAARRARALTPPPPHPPPFACPVLLPKKLLCGARQGRAARLRRARRRR